MAGDNSKVISTIVVVLAIASVNALRSERRGTPDYSSVCQGQPLKTRAQREDAMARGYAIRKDFDCIDRKSFEAINAAEAGAQEHRRQFAGGLEQARKGFATAISDSSMPSSPLPEPPPQLFVRADYQSNGQTLAAFVTPDPRDGEKHPAIIWMTGGDSSTLDDFWTPGPPGNDQSAGSYRNAGMIMMYPTLRGGNTNTGHREFFYGEVDDVLAAAAHLATLPYVDPQQIYLGGHSTGGTLALLVAETSNPFRAVFAFGPASDVRGYGRLFPVSYAQYPEREAQLRSPGNWLEGIRTPTYLIEGRLQRSNIGDLEDMCKATKNPRVHCLPVPGVDHFAVLNKVGRVIAARLVTLPPDPIVAADDFAAAKP